MNSPNRANRSQGLAFRKSATRFCVFLLISGLGTFADLFSKSSVFGALGYPNQQSPPFFDSWVSFRFHTSFNRGALWGIGQDLTWLFAVLSIFAVCIIVYWLFLRGACQSWMLTICLALIMAGTLGNLYDRMGLHGCVDASTNEPIFAVRDFLLFQFGNFSWPVFNIADVCLVCGALCLVAQSLFGKVNDQPATESADV